MKNSLTIYSASLAAIGSFLAANANDWPQFRGPQASGSVDSPALPLYWNGGSGENIRWQTPVPGLGHASPIIWKDRVYVATAEQPGVRAELKVGLYGDIGSFKEKQSHQWRMVCLNKGTGKIVWSKIVYEGVPKVERHTKATHCNSTPATDGQRIVAILGSEGLFCLDMDGKELWRKNLGEMVSAYYAVPSAQWGFASSPVLHEGKVLVQCDVIGEQFLAMYDAKDGKEIWRTIRKDVPTWSTPLVAPAPKGQQVVVSGWKQSAGYELATGRQLWSLTGGGDIPVASPISSGDLIFLTSAHGSSRPMRAIRSDASGDITPPEIGGTNQAIIWNHPRQGSYMQTPIVVGGLLWGCLDYGVVTCFDKQSGKIHYSERLGDGRQGFTASPVASNGRLYFTSEQGQVWVLGATNKFTVLATNSLGGLSLATPAISEGTLFFRTTEKLVAVGGQPPK